MFLTLSFVPSHLNTHAGMLTHNLRTHTHSLYLLTHTYSSHVLTRAPLLPKPEYSNCQLNRDQMEQLCVQAWTMQGANR